MTNRALPPITISRRDFTRLSEFLSKYPPTAGLLEELDRANIVDDSDISGEVVSLDSTVTYTDVDTGITSQVTIVLAERGDPDHQQISILAPIGSALIGMRVGQTIEWNIPRGTKTIRVTSVKQP